MVLLGEWGMTGIILALLLLLSYGAYAYHKVNDDDPTQRRDRWSTKLFTQIPLGITKVKLNTQERERLIEDLAATDCLLFMWSSSPHLDQAIDLMKHWGFKWSTVGFCWDKTRVNPSFYTMSQIELCLIGKKGKIPQPRGARNVRQYVEHPREKHSKKPHEVRKRIELMFPTQNKIELFAREKAIGWDSWGNEC